MKRLPPETRIRCLHALCEGMTIRAAVRLTAVSKTTILKLVEDAGAAAAWYQDCVFQNLPCIRLQVGEIWGFFGAKEANAKAELKATGEKGDVWLATCSTTKIVPVWRIGRRDAHVGLAMLCDLRERLKRRIQLSTDGTTPFADIVDEAFGSDIDYAQVQKIFGHQRDDEARRYSPPMCIGARKVRIVESPAREHISTYHAERNNLNISGCTRGT